MGGGSLALHTAGDRASLQGRSRLERGLTAQNLLGPRSFYLAVTAQTPKMKASLVPEPKPTSAPPLLVPSANS